MRYRFNEHEMEKLKKFLAEAGGYLHKIADEALRLKGSPDIAQSRLIIDGILDQLHNLKRQSSFFGLMEMLMLIRQTQSMLEAMHCGQLQIDVMAVDVLLDAKNTLREITRELNQVSAKLQGDTEIEIELVCAQDVGWLSGFIQQLLQTKRCTALVLVPQALVSKLPAIIQTSLVKLEDQPESCAASSPGEGSPESIIIVNESVEVASGKSPTVGDEKIEQLLSIIRELSTTQNAFNQMSHKLMTEHQLPHLSREARATGQFVNRIAAELEEAVLSMCRVEMGLMFLQFSHTVKDLGLQLGKDICLTIAGEQITVDKTIVKPLHNLLLKILCTMLTLSVEAPAEREPIGKETQGHIWLTAYSSGGKTVFEVVDDGRGMKGSDADAKVLEIFDLMVIMNEVYPQIDILQGHLEMTNPPGKGCKIMITLPPPIMRFSGLVVKVSGEWFIVPVENVVEIVKITTEQLVSKRGRQLLYHRGAVLGIVALSEILGMTAQQPDGVVPVLVVTNGQDKIGLLVHELHSEQEIVPKSLPDYLQNSDYVGGVGITSEGKVALVLNVATLIKKVRPNNGHCRVSN